MIKSSCRNCACSWAGHENEIKKTQGASLSWLQTNDKSSYGDCYRLDPDEVVVVVGDSMDDVSHAVSPFPTAVQSERLGTAHAVLAAREYILDFDGDILVLYGDTPLIKLETLEAMLDARASKLDPGVVVLGFTPDDPGNYGRLILSDDGTLHSIVEVKDATDEQLQIKICNSGVMAIDGKAVWPS